MAAYAAAQMSGPALRWHMSLPRDVQTDWSKLESALLDRFAPNPPAAAAEDKSALTLGATKIRVPTVPRGASAGPQLLTGRIRVTERGTGRFVGYVSNEVAKQDKYTDVITPDVKEAVIVQFAPSSLPVTFELKVDWRSQACVGIYEERSISLASTWHARLTGFSETGVSAL
ncbi:hypothetical protein FRB90_010659 [Tulasnella sp. 427]|nr:hypothetical protein FRB90_010659 [Tulasnella sp. 427]